MPKQKRYLTNYPGIYYVLGKEFNGKPEKIFYIRYTRMGKKVEERAGRQSQDDMTPARANALRTDRIRGAQFSNKQTREHIKEKKNIAQRKYTIDKLWTEYKLNRPHNRNLKVDQGRYENHIEPIFGNKEPKELIKLDVDRVRIKLLKKLSPQTVKHVLNLLTWIINYGTKNNLCQGVSFHIQKPAVYNDKTEDLTPTQLERLLKSIEEDSNVDVGNMMLLALYTGMRRSEIFKLQWNDINFNTGFLLLKDPKGKKPQKLPINDMAEDLLKGVVRTDSAYVFPGRYGGMRTTTGVSSRRIRKNAGLPDDFRPMHGLRHVYASMLASTGKVDMYVLQKLMTHKSPKMTQRYAHLRDDALKKGAGQIDSIFKNPKKDKKIINLK